LQQKVKKRKHMYVPVLITIWVAVSAYVILLGWITMDIIEQVCSVNKVLKTIAPVIFSVGYLLPLALMIFCYSRIVYALRFKVI